MKRVSHLLAVATVCAACTAPSSSTPAPQSLYAPSWAALNETVHGRLFRGTPFAAPCFDGDGAACSALRAGYTDEWTRASAAGAWINTQWETCQATGEQCLLSDGGAGTFSDGSTCEQGSVPDYFIDVRDPGDAAAGFAFARETGLPLVIKNTGHDYKGRSSAPGSLGLWTHNLKNISLEADFVPEGCSEKADGVEKVVIVGAGAQWADGYAFAEENNLTLVGGSDRSVGMAGGWLQGGGHGLLAPAMGLGVDRVLQYRVVTPDGTYRIANLCQNADLFWALRGGGGGTFGVVIEAAILASPRVPLQTVTVVVPAGNKDLSRQLWSVMVANGVQWAEQGWGANAMSNVAVYVNPVLTKEEAAESMAPFIEFGEKLTAAGVEGVKVVLAEVPSWGTFFAAFSTAHVAAVGNSLALASRLINRDNFATSEDQRALVDALLAADDATPGLIILATTPVAFPSAGEDTSVTPLWRESIYHITVVSPWEVNASIEEKQAHYDLASASINNLRRITKHGAYSNEADVNEPEFETSFWGDNYAALLSIKQKYDPEGLLDCWQCVGWKQDDDRFRCYL
ncbi:hypothetical protein BD626DRAFT_481274 [Schizophyllum amplum]|uniref:FAD-binding PCMH-type domain-containing protein n=1 Tax=Schizophyllum amplum TaxID=97359 RepID=A0A550CU10_9AGAR|nr:hypothetical protein BD626DRAFT_481274 [Auriculariopsis ampla]